MHPPLLQPTCRIPALPFLKQQPPERAATLPTMGACCTRPATLDGHGTPPAGVRPSNHTHKLLYGAQQPQGGYGAVPLPQQAYPPPAFAGGYGAYGAAAPPGGAAYPGMPPGVAAYPAPPPGVCAWLFRSWSVAQHGCWEYGNNRYSCRRARKARRHRCQPCLLLLAAACCAVIILPCSLTVLSATLSFSPGYQYGPAAVYGAPPRRPGLGPAGAGMLGAGAGLLGGALFVDAMTPDVVQQTTVVEGGDGGGFDGGRFDGGGFGEF